MVPWRVGGSFPNNAPSPDLNTRASCLEKSLLPDLKWNLRVQFDGKHVLLTVTLLPSQLDLDASFLPSLLINKLSPIHLSSKQSLVRAS